MTTAAPGRRKWSDDLPPAELKRQFGPDLRWAERLVAQAGSGQRVSNLPLKWAREALEQRKKRLFDLEI